METNEKKAAIQYDKPEIEIIEIEIEGMIAASTNSFSGSAQEDPGFLH